MMRTIIAAAALAVMLAGPAGAGCPVSVVTAWPGFLKGEDCGGLSETALSRYVTGLVDGLLFSTLLGASESCVGQYQQCLVGKTDRQLGAVVRQWLENKPARWHEGCNSAVYRAIREMCGIR